MNQSFSLDPGKDLDIIKWLGEKKNKSKTIREALRYKMESEGEVSTELELLQELSRDVKAVQQRLNGMALRTMEEQRSDVGEGKAVPKETKENLRRLQR